MPRYTIFDHDTAPRHHWVQARIILPEGRVKNLSLRITTRPDGPGGAFEITDFRAPDHPEIDWAWIDAHSREVFSSIQFSP